MNTNPPTIIAAMVLGLFLVTSKPFYQSREEGSRLSLLGLGWVKGYYHLVSIMIGSTLVPPHSQGISTCPDVLLSS